MVTMMKFAQVAPIHPTNWTKLHAAGLVNRQTGTGGAGRTRAGAWAWVDGHGRAWNGGRKEEQTDWDG